MADGWLARRAGRESAAGARFDSLADLAFALAVFIVVLVNFALPPWVWVFIGATALLRFISYGLGFFRFHGFVGLHTVLNKAAGAALFALPLLYLLIGAAAGLVLGLICLASAAEELALMARMKTPERDLKGLYKKTGEK